MMSKNLKRITSFVVIVMLVISMSASAAEVEITTTAPMKFERSILPPGDIFSGDEITITYTITPGDLPAIQVKQKEIVLVIDDSGSMDWGVNGQGSTITTANPKRMDVAQDSALNFIKAFKDNDLVDISIVNYSSEAHVTSLLNMGDTSDYNSAKKTIENLSPGGGTNSGDAIRRAYYILANSGNSDAEKFIVFLTDGEPTFYSEESIAVEKTESYWRRVGSWWKNQYEYVTYTYTDYDYIYQESSGNAETTNNSNDYTKGYEYAYKWASLLNMGSTINANTNITPFYIAFSNNEAANKLEAIAKATSNYVEGETYRTALTASSLTSTYNAIRDQIISYSPVKKMYFEEEFPVNIEIISSELPEGFTQIGQSVSSDRPNIVYALNADGTKYVADPIEFKIKVKANEGGDYTLGDNLSTSFIKYTDLDGSIKVKYFGTDNIKVHELNPPTINMSQKISGKDSSFTLTPNGSGNTYFDGDNDYIEFDGSWHDELFGEVNDQWTIKMNLKAQKLNSVASVNGVKNVFLSKGNDAVGSNIELGIDNVTKNLMVYMDGEISAGVGRDQVLTLEGTAFNVNELNEVIVSFDKGVLTASVNGKVMTDYSWNSNSTLTNAASGPLRIGAVGQGYRSDLKNQYFDGSINQIQFFDMAYEQSAFYDGSTMTPFASFDSKGNSDAELKDDSGNGYDSTSVEGAYIQNEAAGDVTLQYKKGVSGTWQTYTLGQTIKVLDLAGQVEVFAKAVRDSNESNEVSRTATKTKSYIDTVTLQGSLAEITWTSDFSVDYTFSGSETTVPTATVASLSLDPIAVTVKVPSNATPIDLPSGWTYDASTNTVEGSIDDGKMSKKVGGKYLFDEKVRTIKFRPKSTSDINIPSGSVDLSYSDYFNDALVLEDVGNPISINVTPTTPTINTIATDDKIDQTEIGAVVISGTADPNATVVIEIADDEDGDVDKTVTVLADAAGVYKTDDLDLNGLSVGSLNVKAIVEDGEGDRKEATRNPEIDIIIPDFDIL